MISSATSEGRCICLTYSIAQQELNIVDVRTAVNKEFDGVETCRVDAIRKGITSTTTYWRSIQFCYCSWGRVWPIGNRHYAIQTFTVRVQSLVILLHSLSHIERRVFDLGK